jgi:hypothetical protein
MVMKLQYPHASSLSGGGGGGGGGSGGGGDGGAPPLCQPDDDSESHPLILVNTIVFAPLSAPLPSANGPLEVVVVHGVVRCGKYHRVLSTQGLYQFLCCHI